MRRWPIRTIKYQHEYFDMKLHLSLILFIFLVSCKNKKSTSDVNCKIAIQSHAKNLLLQQIFDIRYRLRHPSYKLEDIKEYNESLFKLWLSDTDRFNKMHHSLPLYESEQVDMLVSVLIDNDPINLKRFGILTMENNKSHIVVYTNIDEAEKLRLLIIENFNDQNRVFNSYEEEAKRYADKIRSQIRHTNSMK